MTDPQPQSRYNHPAYSRLRFRFQQLPMDAARVADFARAVKDYARSIDAKSDVFSFSS